MFRSWTNPGNVVFILNTIPLQEPGGGPNYYNFGDDVLYRINVDTNADGDEDLAYEIRFKTADSRPADEPRAAARVRRAAADHRARRRGLRGIDPAPELYGDAGPRPVTYRSWHEDDVRRALECRSADDAQLRSLAAQGIYTLANGGKVFAGQRDESFYIDVGAAFDTLNLRRTPPILSRPKTRTTR